MDQVKPVKGAKPCPFCGELIRQVDWISIVGRCGGVAVVHKTADIGETRCALDGQTIYLKAWNKRV